MAGASEMALMDCGKLPETRPYGSPYNSFSGEPPALLGGSLQPRGAADPVRCAAPVPAASHHTRL